MKKKVISILLATVLTVSMLAGCGGSEEAAPEDPGTTEEAPPAEEEDPPAEEEAPPAEEEVVELSVLNYIDMSSAVALEELEVVWAGFEAAYPNIKITRQDEFDESFHQAVEAYAASGELPDVIYAWPSGRSTTLHTQKLLKDLTPLIERDGLADVFSPSMLNPANQVAGYQAILPRSTTATHYFMVNNEVLQEVGLTAATTYSELAEQVPVLREAGYDTVLIANLADWVMQSCMFSMLAGRFCGEGWDQKILNGEAAFTDPNFVAALQFVEQMYADGVISDTTLALDYAEGPGLFANNTAAYYVDGDWSVANLITNQTTGEALIDPERQANFDITVFPEIDVEGVAIPARTNSAVLGTGWGLNANLEDGSPELEAAWTLIKWLTSKEIQEFHLRSGQITAPARTDVDIESLPFEPLQKKLIEMLASGFDVATVVVDGVFQGPVYTPINVGLQQLGMGTTTPEEIAQLTQEALVAWQETEAATE